MENFVVSARKYRPDTFRSVVGQSHITTTLQNAIKQDKLAQAFLFCGPRGVGKTTCARILAKAINCENFGENMEPCNSCPSCNDFNNGTSMNIFELDAASNSSVDDARELIRQVAIPPQSGKYKVYIIDEVHMLSSNAFNALLKTLEEPPSYAKFILATTEKHKIIPTILSRCQVFDFNRISLQDIVDHLAYVAQNEGVTYEDDVLHLIARKADGGMRDALSTFDQLVSFSGNRLTREACLQNLNMLDSSYFFSMVDNFLKSDIASSLLLYNEILDKGFDGQHFITGLDEHLRNLMVAIDPATHPLLEVSDVDRARYGEQSARCGVKLLLQYLNIASDYEYRYRDASNKRLFTEVCLMKLCSCLMPPASSNQPPSGSRPS